MSKYERDVDKEAFWRLALSEQRDSGLSVRAFCVREGLTQSNFYAWRRQLARRDADDGSQQAGSPRFVEVTAPPEVPPEVPPVLMSDGVASPLELVLPRGVVVRVPDRFDAKVLRRVVEALT
jgi:transposase-like protein